MISYIIMKAFESAPHRYDWGLNVISLGHIKMYRLYRMRRAMPHRGYFNRTRRCVRRMILLLLPHKFSTITILYSSVRSKYHMLDSYRSCEAIAIGAAVRTLAGMVTVRTVNDVGFRTYSGETGEIVIRWSRYAPWRAIWLQYI